MLKEITPHDESQTLLPKPSFGKQYRTYLGRKFTSCCCSGKYTAPTKATVDTACGVWFSLSACALIVGTVLADNMSDSQREIYSLTTGISTIASIATIVINQCVYIGCQFDNELI